MGGKTIQLNSLARKIWEWCLPRNIWISASHLPGKDNVEADFESRHFNDRCEWSLHEGVFNRLVQIYGRPDLDLFASRLNAKCSRYVAWQRDPQAEFIDAFSKSWSDLYAYVFPPFSLIGRILQKLRSDGGMALMIVPRWPTQPWFTVFLEMLIEQPLLLLQMDKLLTLKFNSTLHPLRKKLFLIAGHISGKPQESLTYRSGLRLSSSAHGKLEHTNNTQCTFENGTHFVSRGKLVVLRHLSM